MEEDNIQDKEDPPEVKNCPEQSVAPLKERNLGNAALQGRIGSPRMLRPEKNDEIAEMFIKDGINSFAAGQHRIATDYFNLSLMFALSNPVLAMAYAYRSACLYKRMLWEECLVDIERALKHGYPDHLKPNLLGRQSNCKSRLDELKLQVPYCEPAPKILDSNKNAHIECASSCVKIERSIEFGLHVVATRDLEIGEILAVEKPFAALLFETSKMHCDQCLNICYNPIPCDGCPGAVYCSVGCKDNAFNAYHKYECLLLQFIKGEYLTLNVQLALRIVLMTRNSWNRKISRVSDNIYRSNRYQEIRNREASIRRERIPKTCMNSVSQIVRRVVREVSNRTNIFLDGYDPEEFEQFLLGMIFVCNTSKIDINMISPQSLGMYDDFPFAVGLYSFTSLFNHSCYPNVMRHFHRNTVVLRAANTIKKGEQCFVSYGPYYASHPRFFRKQLLRDEFYFNCKCQACEEGWLPEGLTVTNIFTKYYTKLRLFYPNINVVKKSIEELIPLAKEQEAIEPRCDYCIKRLISFCYSLFGNKQLH